MSGGVELDLDIFEVRFIVRTSVESDDLHQPVCRRIGSEKQGGDSVQNVRVFEAFKHSNRSRMRVAWMELPSFTVAAISLYSGKP